MAKSALVQVRLEEETKRQVDDIYHQLGITFADAVRMLAAQTILQRGLPFQPVLAREESPRRSKSLRGRLADRALTGLTLEQIIAREEESLHNEIEKMYGIAAGH